MNNKAVRISIFFSVVWIVVAGFSSCRKTTLLDREYLIFGEYFSECDGDCTHFLLLEENKIYKDHFKSLVKYVGSKIVNTPMTFEQPHLSDEKFKIGNWLLTNFPDYLIENPNKTFGEPDSHDQGSIYIELKQKGKKAIKWRIDRDGGDIPVDIRNYIGEMELIIQKVYF